MDNQINYAKLDLSNLTHLQFVRYKIDLVHEILIIKKIIWQHLLDWLWIEVGILCGEENSVTGLLYRNTFALVPFRSSIPT